MAESARAGTGRYTEQRLREKRRSSPNTDESLVTKIWSKSKRGTPVRVPIPQSAIPAPVTQHAPPQDRGVTTNIPLESWKHLQALQNCDIRQIETGLAFARENKLHHFHALGQYPASEVLQMREILVSQNGSASLAHQSLCSSQASLRHSFASSSPSSARGSIISFSSANTNLSTDAADVILNVDSTAQELAPTNPVSRPQALYYCTCCSVETRWKRKDCWMTHEEGHHRPATWQCSEPNCGLVFVNATAFKAHHKKCSGCKNCDHAQELMTITRTKASFGCGFCGEHFDEFGKRMDHVGKHFKQGKKKNDWKFTTMIEGLLRAPSVHPQWRSLLERHDHDFSDTTRPLTWNKQRSIEEIVVRLEDGCPSDEIGNLLSILYESGTKQHQNHSNDTIEMSTAIWGSTPGSAALAHNDIIEHVQHVSLDRFSNMLNPQSSDETRSQTLRPCPISSVTPPKQVMAPAPDEYLPPSTSDTYSILDELFFNYHDDTGVQISNPIVSPEDASLPYIHQRNEFSTIEMPGHDLNNAEHSSPNFHAPFHSSWDCGRYIHSAGVQEPKTAVKRLHSHRDSISRPHDGQRS